MEFTDCLTAPAGRARTAAPRRPRPATPAIPAPGTAPAPAQRNRGRVHPLVQALNHDWTRMCAHPGNTTAVTRWAATDPALRHLRTLADLTTPTTAAITDQVLYALIGLAQNGDHLATRAVLQLQLGSCINLALRTTDRHAAGDIEESLSRAVAHLYDAVDAYPRGTRNGPHRTGLALDVLRRLTDHTDNRSARLGHVVELPQAELLTALADQPADDQPACDPGHQVDQLLDWAVRHGALTADDAALLRRLHLADAWDTRRAAADLGLSYAALRQRASRATRRLADAVRQTGAPDTWTLLQAAPGTSATNRAA